MGVHITDNLVKELVPPDKGNRITYDDKVSGFGIRVSAGGTKTFILNYRNAEGRHRRYRIGQYGRNRWSVEAARKEAGERKKAVDRGEDPQGDKKAKRDADTVANLCNLYIEEHLPDKRPSSQRNDKQMIDGIIRPKLGSMKVAAVEYSDISRLHRSLKATPYRANRVLALLSKMFSLSIKPWKLRADNPCHGVARFTEVKRKRFLKPEEIERLTKVLADHPNTKAANVLRLCLLTGCRVGEALGATVDQFDLSERKAKWTKPGATTKQKSEHEVPLGAAAVILVKDILAERNAESPFIFPGRTADAPLDNIKKSWETIRRAADIADVRIHDLRHTYASILVSAGASLPLIGALLGHTQPATTQRYAHMFDDPLRKAANEVGNIVTGATSAEVIPVREGRID